MEGKIRGKKKGEEKGRIMKTPEEENEARRLGGKLCLEERRKRKENV